MHGERVDTPEAFSIQRLTTSLLRRWLEMRGFPARLKIVQVSAGVLDQNSLQGLLKFRTG